MKSGMFLATLLTLALGLGLAAPPAQAQHDSWLIPHLTSFYTLPSPALDNVPTTLVLWGWFGYMGGEVVDANVIDPSHIELTLRPGPAVQDTGEVWHQPFALGLLAAGQHPVHIKLTYVDTNQSVTVSEADFSFEVVAHDNLPPPPPPPNDPPSSLVRGLSGFNTYPAPPNSMEPTTLTLWGWFAYDCGQVTNAEVVDANHVKLTLSPSSACPDTGRAWSQSFALGLLQAGTHPITLEMTVIGDPADSGVTATRVASFNFEVTDGVTAPPPPPIVDSLSTTPGHPNPFALRTQFRVSLARGTKIDVGIFDLQGREVVNLHRGFAPAGDHEFAWDGRRVSGARAPGGVYFYRVAADGRVVSRRLVLLPKP